jgi:hypothetical protein
MHIKAQVDKGVYGKDMAVRSWEACPHANAELTVQTRAMALLARSG